MCIFIGYSINSKGYRLFCPDKNKVIISRDVKFNEVVTPGNLSNDFDNSFKYKLFSFENDDDIDSIDESSVEQEPRYPRRERRAPDRYGERSCIAEVSEPKSVTEALNSEYSEQWLNAMNVEIDNMNRNDVYDLVELPEDASIIKCKWIFKLKPNKFKARIVAQGYSQKPGVDYDETFAPVVKFESIRAILSLSAYNSMYVHHLDITAAFLNGYLDRDDIFMSQPEGCIVKGKENMVWRLKRSIYGLKQSPRCWNTSIDSELQKIGFIKSKADPCIYVSSEGDQIILAIYVDDIVLAAKSLDVINSIKCKLSNLYELKDLGELKSFLGIEIDQSANGIWVGQSKFCNDLLKAYNMENCKQIDTPVDISIKMIKNDCNEMFDKTIYQSCVGSLLYLSIKTRPDICFAVNQVAKFCANPTKVYWLAVKRILRYLKGTVFLGLFYSNEYNSNLCGYADSDFAGDLNDRKSTSGYIFMLNNGVISWSSKKQTVVALSTAEAELVALSHASQEAVWFRKLFRDFSLLINEPTVIFEDNQSTICIGNNNICSTKTKHVAIKHFYVRDLVELKEIELKYCPTDLMLADVCTKGLPKIKFNKLVALIGMTKRNL